MRDVNLRQVSIGLAAVSVLGLLYRKMEPGLKDGPGLAQSMPVIRTLDPKLQKIAREILARAWHQKIPLVVTSGRRDPAEQNRLYAQGRTTPGAIVTNVRAGGSWHNYGLAFDVALLVNGRPTWPNDVSLWRRIGTIGKTTGAKWGGDWSKPDYPHFEYHPGLTIQEMKARSGLV